MIGLVLALQAAPIQQATLVIRHDTTELGRESFVLVARPSGGGWTLSSSAAYGIGGAGAVRTTTIVLGADSALQTFQIEARDRAGSLQLHGQVTSSRITVRSVAGGRERLRELGATAPLVVLDDSVYAPLLLATWYVGTTPLSGIRPTAARVQPLAVSDLGTTATTLNRDPVRLRCVRIADQSGPRFRVCTDAAGALMKVEDTITGIIVERLPSP